MKKVFVIGSNSFSGGSFVNLLLKKNYIVFGISRSSLNKKSLLNFDHKNIRFKFIKLSIVSNQNEIIQLIKKERPKYIINYAAQSMVGQSWDNPQDWFLTNSYSMPILYKKIYDLNIITKLIHISTPEVYGNSSKVIKVNNNFKPSTPYAVSRTTADSYLEILNEFYGYPYVAIRAANVYGEYQKLYRIIPKTIGYFINNKKIELHGGGLSKRSFIHIDDVSKATFLIMTKGNNGEVYHISSDELISIRMLVKKISKNLNVNYFKLTKITKDRIGKDKAYILDSTKTKKLGWKAEISLDEGIERVIKWFSKYSKQFNDSDYYYKHKK